MTELIIQPHIELAPIEKRGSFTIHREDARLMCNCPQKRGDGCGGIAIRDIPLQFRNFERLCTAYGKRFIDRMRPRGFEFVDGADLLLHGPFPSYELNKNLADVTSGEWARAMYRDKADDLEHRERVLPFVFEVDPLGEFVDYVLVGTFLMRDVYTEIEVPSGQ